MPITFYRGTYIGVDPITIIRGDGYEPPRLEHARIEGYNNIIVYFDHDMLETGGVLDPLNYIMSPQTTDPAPSVVDVEKIDARTYNIYTSDHLPIKYTFSATNMVDTYGTLLDGYYNNKELEGYEYVGLFTLAFESFLGLESGMQYVHTVLDSGPPVLFQRVPTPNQTAVTRFLTSVSFDFYDVSSNVVPESIDVYVDGNWIYNGGKDKFYFPWDGPGSKRVHTKYGPDEYDGYHIYLDYNDLPFAPFITLEWRALANDIFNNPTDETWSWRIEDIEEPLFIIPDVAGTTDAERDVEFTTKFYDRHSGIDASTIQAWVNSQLAYDGTDGFFHIPFDGPNSALTAVVMEGYDGMMYDGYELTIDRAGLYEAGGAVFVTVNVRDKEGN